MHTNPFHNTDISTDWLVAHHVHMSVCGAVLNCTQVSELLLDLQRKLPNVPNDVLLQKAQATLKQLVCSGAVEVFVTEGDSSHFFGSKEAMQEIENSSCWRAGGRYLVATTMQGTTYFASIYNNLLQYALSGIPDV